MSSGNAPLEDTKVLHGFDDTVKAVENALCKTRVRWDSCVDAAAPSISMTQIRKTYFDAGERGVKIRYITEITKDNLGYCKEIMKIAELRHFARLKGSFAVSDTEYVAGIKDDSGQFTGCIYSNVRQMVEHHRSIFEMFWHNALPAESRIREIEGGITLSVLQIISNPADSLQRAYDRIKSAKEEVLIMFSTPNAVRRQLRMGVYQAIEEAAAKSVKIRVLVPADKELEERLKEIKSALPQIEIKNIGERLKTRISIWVVDRRESFIFETKDDTKDSSYEALGQSIYSNSETAGASFASIFESIWNQSELYEKLKEVNAMKEEFINVAAHELRTPVLPIILSAEELAEEEGQRVQKNDRVRIILRNARRLRKLTNDILDVSRIESNTFHLRKEESDLRELIEESIQDAYFTLSENNKEQDVKIHLEYGLPAGMRQIPLDKDRTRQVVANLLDNAIKFTEHGTITVSVKQSEKFSSSVEIRVSDTGKGIDGSIKDRLFEKFMTKSEKKGSGLGLYLCKAIVEAHGGKIWVEDNNLGGGKGATFAFTLPIK